MKELGEHLRKAREASGLSLADLHARTKIRERFLAAIEDGDFHLLPGEVYARGFLKTYAVVVGLDPQDTLARYEALARRFDAPAAPPGRSGPGGGNVSALRWHARPHSRWLLFGSLGVVLLIGIAVALLALDPDVDEGTFGAELAGPTGPGAPPQDHAGGPRLPASGSGEPESVPEAAFEAAPETLPESGPATPWYDVPPPVPPAPLPAPGDAGEREEPEEGRRPAGAEPDAGGRRDTNAVLQVFRPRDEPPFLRLDRVVLAASARERCWVEVVADGVRVFRRTLEVGEEVTWEAREILQIRFGNPFGLDLTLNGVPLGVAGYGGPIDREFTREQAEELRSKLGGLR